MESSWTIIMIKNITLLLILSFYSVSSLASFVSNIYTPGTNITVITDTETGLEWLNLRATTGLTVNDILNGVDNNWLQEFNYATQTQFNVLGNSIFGSYPFDGDTILNNMSLFGITYSTDNGSAKSWKNIGFLDPFAGDPLQVDIAQFAAAVSTFSPFSGGYNINFDDVDLDHTNVIVGSWLVREASVVPIPAAVWLFGSGLLGLVGVARRKASI